MGQDARCQAVTDWHAALHGMFPKDVAYWPMFLAVWEMIGIVYTIRGIPEDSLVDWRDAT